MPAKTTHRRRRFTGRRKSYRSKPAFRRTGRSSGYRQRLNMSLGGNMKCFPVVGSCYLSIQNLTLQPYLGVARVEEILVTIPFNLVGSDIFAYVTTGFTGTQKLPSPTNTCCIGSLIPIKEFKMSNGGTNEIFNPKLEAFMKYPDFWCGGLKYQWEPPRYQQTFINAAAPEILDFADVQLDLNTFGSQNILKNVLDTSFGAPERIKPTVNWSRVIANPWIKNRSYDFGPVSGFIKNPQASGRLEIPYYTSLKVNEDDVTGSDITDELYNSVTNSGTANFLFRLTISANMSADTIKHLSLGMITVKKFFFHDTRGGANIINMKYNDANVKPNPI